MGKRFVMGDIHGAFRALKQCLQRSGFDYEKDQLICLGDVCDGWPETRECIDELLKIRHLTFILGNHDAWSLEWMETSNVDATWMKHGGKTTIKSYMDGVPKSHQNFLSRALLYFLTDNKLFVHAGLDPSVEIEDQGADILLWDRAFQRMAMEHYNSGSTGHLTSFDEVYIGHTPIPFTHPIKAMEVWMIDTGAAWSGMLSMMNIDTKEVFQSDQVESLYPEVEGRQK